MGRQRDAATSTCFVSSRRHRFSVSPFLHASVSPLLRFFASQPVRPALERGRKNASPPEASAKFRRPRIQVNPCRLRDHTRGNRLFPLARRASEGSQKLRSAFLRSSGGFELSFFDGSRWRALCRALRPRRAYPCAPGTLAHTPIGSPHTDAGLPHRSCRRPATICRSRSRP